MASDHMRATYEDLLNLADPSVAEIVAGELCMSHWWID